MKKFSKIIISSVVSLCLLLITGCSVIYSGIACSDKAIREVFACAFEAAACTNDCFGCFVPLDCKECYDGAYVACPLACADCIRNPIDDDATLGCMGCVEEAAETYISNDYYTYKYEVDYNTNGLPSGYCRAVVTIVITPNVNLKNVICEFDFNNGNTQIGSSKLYFGVMHKGITYKQSTSFNFKGYGGLANANVSKVYLKGVFSNY